VLAEVVQVEREWRAAIRSHEDDVMRAMAKRYVGIADRLMSEFEALAEQVTRMAAADQPVAVGKLYQLERYQRMAARMDAEWAQFKPYAADLITKEQTYLLNAGAEAAQDLVEAGGYKVAVETFPASAVEAMVGQTEGGPLRDLLAGITEGTDGDIGQKLAEGVGLGKNPTVIAKEMADTFGMPLARALTIARTEMLSAYRSSTLNSYNKYGVQRYERMSAQDSRVCPGCIAAEGQLFETEQDFDDHPNCRCSCLPWWPGIGGDFKMGEDWFKEQDEGTQLDILGQTRLDMWKNGDVKFEQFATKTTDPTWGGSIGATSIGDLRKGLGGVPTAGTKGLPPGLPGTTTLNAFTALPTPDLAPAVKPTAKEMEDWGTVMSALKEQSQDTFDTLVTPMLDNPAIPDWKKADLLNLKAEQMATKWTPSKLGDAAWTLPKESIAKAGGKVQGDLFGGMKAEDIVSSETEFVLDTFKDSTEKVVKDYLDKVLAGQPTSVTDPILKAWQEMNAAKVVAKQAAEAAAEQAAKEVAARELERVKTVLAERAAREGEQVEDILDDFKLEGVTAQSDIEGTILPYNNDVAQKMGLDEYGGLMSDADASAFKAEVQRDLTQMLKGDEAWESWVEGKFVDSLGYTSREQFLAEHMKGLYQGTEAERIASLEARLAARSARMVNDLVHRWAETSGDEYPEAIAMQMAARDEFGILDATLDHFAGRGLARAAEVYATDGPALRAFLRAMYDNTQAYFGGEGFPDYITLYRGVYLSEQQLLEAGLSLPEAGYNAAVINAQLQPMSSFSLQRATAGNFASTHEAGKFPVIIATRVPTSRVIGTFRSGYGCADETEFVVLGGDVRLPACAERAYSSGQGPWWSGDAEFPLWLKSLETGNTADYTTWSAGR